MRSIALLLLTASAALAQTPVVSPAFYATREGNTFSTTPFSANRARYQQVHGDLRGQAFVVKSIKLRRDGLANFAYRARTVTLEAYMARSDHSKLSATFASNYTAPPTQVLKPRAVRLPNWTGRPPGTPSPFDLTVPFDRPWAYDGKTDFLWEVRMTSAGGNRLLIAFVDAFRNRGYLPDLGRRLGVGCRSRNTRMPLELIADLRTYRTPRQHTIAWNGKWAPPRSQVTVAVGLTDPRLQIGLCTTVHVLPLATVSARANVIGGYATKPITLPYDPTLVGVKTYAQAIVADRAQTPPFSLSNGVEAALPPLPGAPFSIGRVYSGQGPGATTGTLTNGSGLVTAFVR